MKQSFAQRCVRSAAMALSLAGVVLMSACTSVADGSAVATNHPSMIGLPLVPGWFEGHRVWYVTTDISDKAMADAGQANYVPRLANALPPEPSVPGKPSAVERIYKFMNVDQPSVLPSIPQPMGGGNTNVNYSPFWQLYAVFWLPGKTPHELRSEQELLDAQDQGLVDIKPLRIIVNCPVVQVEQTVLQGAKRL